MDQDIDSIVNSVIQKFVYRAKTGNDGPGAEHKDLTILDWIVHAQEKNMDSILYLERLKQELINAGYKTV